MYATAVLCLVEDGRLGLNRPVQEYLPEFVGTGKEHVLVRHLLTHTAGLDDQAIRRHVAQPMEASGSGTATALSRARENLLLSLAAPLATPPGIAMLYSSIGYEFLGEIVRRVSEQPLAVFMAERLWGPLGMADTSFGVPEQRHRIARRRPPETTTAG
ncbi:MAG: serine hydrolase domain-containing protein [Chloroflexota bacterium]